MQLLLDAVVDLVGLVSPAKARSVASALRGLPSPLAAPNANTLAETPAARAAVARVVGAWSQVPVSGDEIAGMLVGASARRTRAERRAGLDGADDALRPNAKDGAGAPRSDRERHG